MFNGLAFYSTGVFDATAEDVSDEVGLISPAETPLLDLLGTSNYETGNVLHEWLEDSLNPATLVASSAIASSAAVTAVGVAGGKAAQSRVGQVLITASNEYVQITSIAGNTIHVSRGFGSTVATSADVGTSLTLVADAALEGDDVINDTSAPRVRQMNYCQIFKKDVIVSGTRQATTNLGGIGDEFGYQRANRLREMLRDLDKAAILGILSGNTIGTASGTRTTKGLRSFINTNAQSIGPTLTDSWLGNTIKLAWDNGGVDASLIVAGASYKRLIDNLNGSRVRTVNADNRFRNVVQEYEGTFGVQRVMLHRWMPASQLLVLAPGRIKVVPLRGRTFQFQEASRTGDSQKG